jgi:hypothetical protein
MYEFWCDPFYEVLAATYYNFGMNNIHIPKEERTSLLVRNNHIILVGNEGFHKQQIMKSNKKIIRRFFAV